MILSEYDLIEQAKNNNKSALNSLLTDSYPILKGYLIKMTGNIDIAQDIAQETMMKAVLNIKRFDPKAKFSTWLIKVATNVYRDYLRKNKRLVELSEDLIAKDSDVEDKVLSNIEYEEVKKILQKLPYEKREVFILKHFYGYKYEEIAEIANCPIGTVRSRLHNAVKYIVSEMERRDAV